MGVQICEDLWDSDYNIKVTDILSEKGADIIINLSSSPFNINRFNDRIKVVKNQVKKNNRPYLYCNSVGYQEELVFDGQSFAVNKEGALIAYGKPFEEDVLLVDIFTKNECKIKMLDKNVEDN